MHLSKKILNKLIINNISVSTAESCTGGLLAYNFVKNRDSSKVFKGGYITYSNEMKVKELKVKKSSLKKNGAVSYQVAEEMIEGLERSSEENKRKGEFIYENYEQIKNILTEIIKAKEKFSWKDIKEKLKGHKVIKQVNEKEGKITVELK